METNPKFRGNKNNMGNREHKKTNFRFLGNRSIYFRITREQIPTGRASSLHNVTKYVNHQWSMNFNR